MNSQNQSKTETVQISHCNQGIVDAYEDFEESYETNNTYEFKLLEIIENGIKQYKTLYPQRMPLMIAPMNEYKIHKCVCKTIKPSILRNKPLISFEDSAKFVSHYLNYVKLSEFNTLPSEIASPTLVLKRQYGNCFEIANVLVSLLIGQGYDSYVVSGYASREICNQDLSQIKYIHSKEIDRSLRIIEKIRKEFSLNKNSKLPEKYGRSLLTSNYDKCMKKRQEKVKEEINAAKSATDMSKPIDPLRGLRIHSWILILPNSRNVKDAFFIEPSTGQIKSVLDEEYHGIESVWNNCNYWINLQDCSNGIKEIDFNLKNTNKWETFFQIPFDEKALLFKSWVNKLDISAKDALKIYPNSQKIQIFKRTLVKHYAPHNHKNGCILKVLEFKDDQMNELNRSTFEYNAKANNLFRKVFDYTNNLITEFYHSGNKSGLLFNQYSLKATSRVLIFDSYLRKDCLRIYEESETSIEQYFSNRKDLLFYKKTFFCSSSTSLDSLSKEHTKKDSIFNIKSLKSKQERRKIEKIIERYQKSLTNGSNNSLNDIFEITFDLVFKKIHVIYHKTNDSITQTTKTFSKPQTDDIDLNNITKYLTKSYDKYEESSFYNKELFKLLRHLTKREASSVEEVKRAEDDVQEVLKQLSNDELLNEFKQNPFNIDVSHLQKQSMVQEEKTKIGSLSRHNDLLNNCEIFQPYLINDSLNVDLESIKQKCLFDLQNNILFKINKLQKQYDQEKIELLNHIGLLRRKSTGHDNSTSDDLNKITGDYNEKEILKAVEKHKFNVDVLAQRINHLKIKAQEDYQALKAQTENDPCLKPE